MTRARHRWRAAGVPFAPVLACFLWGATIWIWLDDSTPPIPLKEALAGWTEPAWVALSLTCPPLMLLSWWLTHFSRLPGAERAGMWMRLAADAGQLSALLAYHVATLREMIDESRVYERNIVMAVSAFLALSTIRDVWALAKRRDGQR